MSRKRVGVALITSRRNVAEHARRLARAGAGRVDRRPRSRGSRAAPGRAAAGRRWRAGWRSSAARPRGASAASSARSAPRVVEQLLGPVGAHPLLELRQVLGVVADVGQRHLVRAEVPSAGRPSTILGPVQPFGVRSTIIGHRGRPGRAAARAAAGSRRSRSSASSSAAAISWCIAGGSSALDEAAARSRSPRSSALSSSRRSAPARSGWRSCSR